MNRRYRSPPPIPPIQKALKSTETINHPFLGPGKIQAKVVVSPQKKPRVVKSGGERKRKCPTSSTQGLTEQHDFEDILEDNNHYSLSNVSDLEPAHFGRASPTPVLIHDSLNVSNGDESASSESLDMFTQYVNAVQSDCVGFIQLGNDIFVVEGWKRRVGEGTVGIWTLMYKPSLRY